MQFAGNIEATEQLLTRHLGKNEAAQIPNPERLRTLSPV
jgi:hypothetical protein